MSVHTISVKHYFCSATITCTITACAVMSFQRTFKRTVDTYHFMFTVMHFKPYVMMITATACHTEVTVITYTVVVIINRIVHIKGYCTVIVCTVVKVFCIVIVCKPLCCWYVAMHKFTVYKLYGNTAVITETICISICMCCRWLYRVAAGTVECMFFFICIPPSASILVQARYIVATVITNLVVIVIYVEKTIAICLFAYRADCVVACRT